MLIAFTIEDTSRSINDDFGYFGLANWRSLDVLKNMFNKLKNVINSIGFDVMGNESTSMLACSTNQLTRLLLKLIF